MKKLIVTTAVALTIVSTAGYMAHERQVEQLRYKYNVQLKQVSDDNNLLNAKYRKLEKENKNLIEYNIKKSDAILKQDMEIQRLEKQIEEEKKWITFSASAYTTHTNGDAFTSGKWGDRTASGTVPTQGRTIAVDKKLISLGTKLLVKFPEPYSYLDGTYIAEDTGNAIKGNKADLYLNNRNACIQFGVKDIHVKIIN